jgi:hypothetical protein
MKTETDTPRTDAASPEFDGITNDHVIRVLRIFGKEKMTKDGSLESWIRLAADRLEKAEDEINELKENSQRIGVNRYQKINTLQSQLKRAVEIAETSCRYLDQGGENEDELYSGKEGWVTEKEIDEVCEKLALLKEEIK